MTRHSHQLAESLPPALNIACPPAKAAAARHYPELVDRLKELGARLDRSGCSLRDLILWEQNVLPLLSDAEREVLLSRRNETGYDPEDLPDLRWRNLRRILMRRKGLRL